MEKEIALIISGPIFVAIGATNRNGKPSIIHWYNFLAGVGIAAWMVLTLHAQLVYNKGFL